MNKTSSSPEKEPVALSILLIVFCLLAIAVVLLLPLHTMQADAVYQGF